MRIIENIKKDFIIAKTRKNEQRIWLNDYNKLKQYEDMLIKRDRLSQKILDDLKKKQRRINSAYHLENYVLYGCGFMRIIRKITMGGDTMLFILLTKSKKIKMIYKKIRGDEIIYKGLPYKIIPEFMLRLKSDQAGIWLENKMLQLDPVKINYKAQDKVSAANWKNIFDEKLTNAVFNPKEKKKFEFDWRVLLVIAVIILVLLQAFGLVDIGQLLNAMVNR